MIGFFGSSNRQALKGFPQPDQTAAGLVDLFACGLRDRVLATCLIRQENWPVRDWKTWNSYGEVPRNFLISSCSGYLSHPPGKLPYRGCSSNLSNPGKFGLIREFPNVVLKKKAPE